VVTHEHLDSLLRDRVTAVEGAIRAGSKIVGYFPGPYVPEEMIHASGAVPVCLANGGSARTADHALSVLPPAICPFARAQVGEILLKTDPVYAAVDMVVVPSTCQHLRKTGDMWEYFESTEVFKLGVPYDPAEDLALTYYRDRLSDLRERLELLTGNPITNTSISEAIAVYDRLRRALRNVSLLRQSHPPGISGLEFAKLNHATLFGDPEGMAEVVETVLRERRNTGPVARAGLPRLLVIGPNVAVGDYGILEMVEGAGAGVVIEDVFEGIRDYWYETGGVREGEDVLDALVRSRVADRTPAAFMRSSSAPRFEVVSRLIRDFQVSGVIWYELLGCEFYDQDAFYFEDRLRRMGVPMLVVESDYDDMRSGSVHTRIEAFLEVIQGGPADA